MKFIEISIVLLFYVFHIRAQSICQQLMITEPLFKKLIEVEEQKKDHFPRLFLCHFSKNCKFESCSNPEGFDILKEIELHQKIIDTVTNILGSNIWILNVETLINLCSNQNLLALLSKDNDKFSCDVSKIEESENGAGEGNIPDPPISLPGSNPDPNCISFTNCQSSEQTMKEMPDNFKCLELDSNIGADSNICIVGNDSFFKKCINPSIVSFSVLVAKLGNHHIVSPEGTNVIEKIVAEGSIPTCHSENESLLNCEIGCLRTNSWECQGNEAFCSSHRCTNWGTGICTCELKGHISMFRVFKGAECYEGMFEFKSYKVHYELGAKLTVKKHEDSLYTSLYVKDKNLVYSTSIPSLMQINLHFVDGKSSVLGYKVFDELILPLNTTFLRSLKSIDFVPTLHKSLAKTFDPRSVDSCDYLECTYCLDAIHDFDCLNSKHQAILSLVTGLTVTVSVFLGVLFLFFIYCLLKSGTLTLWNIGQFLAFILFFWIIIIYWIWIGIKWMFAKFTKFSKEKGLARKIENNAKSLAIGMTATTFRGSEAVPLDGFKRMTEDASDAYLYVVSLQWKIMLFLFIFIILGISVAYYSYKRYIEIKILRMLNEKDELIPMYKRNIVEKEDLDIEYQADQLEIETKPTFTKPVVYLRGFRYKRIAPIMMYTILSLMTFVESCSDGFILTSPTENCVKKADGVTLECTVNLNIDLTIYDKKSTTCITLRHNNDGDTLGELEITYVDLNCYWLSSIEYYTSNWKGMVTYRKRCAHSGECKKGVGCPLQKDLDKSAGVELNIGHDELGRNYCESSCGCAGCGCFLCSDGCMFYRWYVVPGQNVYRISSLNDQFCEPKIHTKLTLVGQAPIESEVILKNGAVSVDQYISYRLASPVMVNYPSFNDYKWAEGVSGDRSSYLVQATTVNVQTPGAVGELQFASIDDLLQNRNKKMLFMSSAVKCFKTSSSRVDCEFPRNTVDFTPERQFPLFHNQAQLEATGGRIQSKSFNQPVHLHLTSTKPLTISRTINEVSPKATFIRTEGCFRCMENAKIIIEAWSSSLEGAVSLETSDPDIQLFTSSIFLKKQSEEFRINYHSSKKKVNFHLKIQSRVSSFISIQISGELKESENVKPDDPNWGESNESSKNPGINKCEQPLSFDCWSFWGVISKILMLLFVLVLVKLFFVFYNYIAGLIKAKRN